MKQIGAEIFEVVVAILFSDCAVRMNGAFDDETGLGAI